MLRYYYQFKNLQLVNEQDFKLIQIQVFYIQDSQVQYPTTIKCILCGNDAKQNNLIIKLYLLKYNQLNILRNMLQMLYLLFFRIPNKGVFVLIFQFCIYLIQS
ncbi:transmembrane protein, putative (macronuclear) [Tetrahymena thermophila SB210]|uniref:Transmembrane protein, putative n=1 Tax=Tetrahymena thermophila (strain SB210) TaxID=312017 RepID=W7XL63_TETTS|nr:transmembrane protein, putative [Tetrahymena thermophila SB210]EWS75739.1 transmembrane protein, putative [Tetrahymena thermophila SB210]|eukprot:XP_012651661.1 transmembrane protein, putative [Tetrahymena thermophila SB210]